MPQEIPAKGDSFVRFVAETGHMRKAIVPMTPYIFWLDRPFKPGPSTAASRRFRRGHYVVTIRYRGSFSRSVFKVFVVIAFISVMAAV
jgi:hypothetical protein